MQTQTTSELLFSLFMRSSHLIGRGHHHRGGWHHGQGQILSILSKHESLSQKNLLEIAQVRSASLSELLSKLETNGYITRGKDEQDKRSTKITITEIGKTTADEHMKRKKESAEALFTSLTEEEQITLSNLLLKLFNTWQEERDADNSRHHHERHQQHCKHQHRHCHERQHHENHRQNDKNSISIKDEF